MGVLDAMARRQTIQSHNGDSHGDHQTWHVGAKVDADNHD